MIDPKSCTLYSGAAPGAEAYFGQLAEHYGLAEVNYSFEGHKTERDRGLRVLTPEELAKKDISLAYVSKLLNRSFTNAPLMRKVLQTIMHQIEAGHEVFVVGSIMPDNTVKGGTGWGAEFAKICNKPLYVFDQAQNGWFAWEADRFVKLPDPKISKTHITGAGTRFLEANGKVALEALFKRSFG